MNPADTTYVPDEYRHHPTHRQALFTVTTTVHEDGGGDIVSVRCDECGHETPTIEPMWAHLRTHGWRR